MNPASLEAGRAYLGGKGDETLSRLENSLCASPIEIALLGGERSMLSWSLMFLIIAIIAALFGFGGIAGTAAWMAKVLFMIFLIAFVASLIFGRSGPSR